MAIPQLDSLWASYEAAKKAEDEKRAKFNEVGASIKKLENDIVALNNVGNTQAAWELGNQIVTQQAPWYNQLGNELIALVAITKQKYADWENAKNSLNPIEQQAYQQQLTAAVQAQQAAAQEKAAAAKKAAEEAAALEKANFASGNTKYIIGAVVLLVIVLVVAWRFKRNKS